MLSYKSYRLREASAPPQGAPVPHKPSLDGMALLESSVINQVGISFEELRKDLRNREGEGNPFNVMRKNLPLWRRLKNWWGRFWNNDTRGESQDYGLEFSEIIPLHEQEAFNELALLVEGPVNDAISLLEFKINDLEKRLIFKVRQIFSDYRAGASHTPVGSATPAPPGSPEAPGPQQGGTATSAPTPRDATLPTAGDVPEPEVDGTPPGDVPTPPAPVKEFKTGEYGLVKRAETEDGTVHKVGYAEYDPAGTLVAVKLAGSDRVINVPAELGEKHRISYGAHKGTVRDIRRAIIASKTEAPADAPRPEGEPQGSEARPDAPPEPGMKVYAPGEPAPPWQNHNDEEDLDMVDPKTGTLWNPGTKKEPPPYDPVPKVSDWINEKARLLKPNLASVLASLPPEGRLSVAAFIEGMLPLTRLELFNKKSDVMDTREEDLGKLLWIVKMTPEEARAAGRKLSDWHDPDDEARLAAILSDEGTFHDFLKMPDG